MGRTRKTAHASLGMALVKKKKAYWNRETNAEHIAAPEPSSSALKSVTEESPYDEFIATATLANKEFTAEKLNVKFVALSTAEKEEDDILTEKEREQVVVPRRPKWNKEMTAEELDDAEREAFLEWRRAMAHLQTKEGITPFERNIEVWRQLWRVVERSHVVVQIVDARNPLLYRCEDLERYVKEMGKENVLLINKADFLTLKQRALWSNYFSSICLAHAFYSAVAATKTPKSEEEIPEEEEGADNDGNEESLEETGDEEDMSSEEESYGARANEAHEPELEEEPVIVKILTRKGLVEFLRSFQRLAKGDILAVGLVGYPNVGKSSTINSLMSAKKTSVSSTPGKTKHFQTLFLEDDVLLCDCPGLVMPAFGGSKGDMVLGGILPIDQLTSYTSAADLLVQRIPMSVLEYHYGVTLPKTYNYDDFLNAYAALRGFMTVRGIPDCSRAARIVLKDYVNGKLCYCQSPPNIADEDFLPAISNKGYHSTAGQGAEPNEAELSRETRRPLPTKSRMENALDRQFFIPAPSYAHIKGKQYISTGTTASASNSTSSLDAKPWKKHANRNKKEKLRRVYRHLDVE